MGLRPDLIRRIPTMTLRRDAEGIAFPDDFSVISDDCLMGMMGPYETAKPDHPAFTPTTLSEREAHADAFFAAELAD